MMTTGFSLAVITATGFYMVYRKLPTSIREFMQRHVLLTDVVACLLTYMLFGGTLVALFAAAFMGLFTSVLLAMANDPRTAGALEKLAKRIVAAKDKLVDGLARICEDKKASEAN